MNNTSNKDKAIIALLEEILRCLKFLIVFVVVKSFTGKNLGAYNGLLCAWRETGSCMSDEILRIYPEYKHYAEKYKHDI